MITDGLTPLTLLLFLGAGLGGAALIATYVLARVSKRADLGRIALRLLAGGVGVYAVLLTVASLTSRSRVLAPGEEKHICEIDCHLAYSVAAANSAPLADGRTRHIVTVKVLFDKETVSRGRPPDAALSPNSRYVALIDAQGRVYPGSTDSLRRRLVPGESYTTDLVFDVPADATDLRLILRSADPETAFLIGHENSLLHRQTTFRLPG